MDLHVHADVATTQAVTVELAGGPEQCRRAAVNSALDEVAAAVAGTDEPVLALRCYEPGGLVVALGGHFDPAAVDRLRGRVVELRARARTELVLECFHLGPSCGGPLARVLARLRVQCLIEGARVELHHCPAELRAELGRTTPQAYTVTDDARERPGVVHRGRPRTGSRPRRPDR